MNSTAYIHLVDYLNFQDVVREKNYISETI